MIYSAGTRCPGAACAGGTCANASFARPRLRAAPPLLEALDHHEEGRHEQNLQAGRGDHAVNTAMPIDLHALALAPAPLATTSGATPRMKAKDVITIGRKRDRAVSTALSTIALPCWRRSRAAHGGRSRHTIPRLA